MEYEYFFYGTLSTSLIFLIFFLFSRKKQIQENKKFFLKISLFFGVVIILAATPLLYHSIYFHLLDIPDLRQMYGYTCGVSSLQTVLFYYGIDIKEGDLAKKLQTGEWGTEHHNIQKVAMEYGLKVAMGQMTIQDLKRYINQKIPVIIALQAWSDIKDIDYQKTYEEGHYVVVIGYNREGFLFEDPSTVGRGFLSYEELKARWHDIDKNQNKLENLGIAIYGKPVQYRSNMIHRIE